MTETKPVELLRDRRGIYGIGVSDAYDIEARAWACGVEPRATQHRHSRPRDLILRPDMLRSAGNYTYAVLQKIFFNTQLFRNSHEESLREFIHHEMLMRAGLPIRWWSCSSNTERWWSKDKKQQARNRQRYHGMRVGSLNIINTLVATALEQAADQDALKIARRFPYRYRELIYRAAATSLRARQLAETFPVLALEVYCWSNESGATDGQRKQVAQEAASLVERGVRLRDVAAVMRVPMALRRVKPGAVRHVCEELGERHDLLAFLPNSLPHMRYWLRAVCEAWRHSGVDFAEWTAKNALRLPGGQQYERLTFLSDLADWVNASRCFLSPPEPWAPEMEFLADQGHCFITLPFQPTMSVQTVMKLSAEWHEAVASNLSGPQHAFPQPWFPAATINGVEIIPIDNSADLYREGLFMHHCIGTYADKVRGGRYSVYSIRRNGQRVASAGLILQSARGGTASTPRPM
jgi:hypothetical protein